MKKYSSLAVKLQGVSKIYTIHHEKPTLVEKFINHKEEKFVALNDINLEIKKGEKVGIIGPNGSGKTTLLKIIAGITSPTKGKVKTWGKIISIIDLEAGFHPDLTGEQNIYLNGMILGMQRESIKDRINKIINFADIGSFIDTPLFTYSEGMKLRLGFSIAVHANPDILILDESMWAGDLEFEKKSTAKLKEFFRMKKTILVVSHWLSYIEKNCKRVLLIDEGKIIRDGSIKVINEYRKQQS
ncbi:MAG TPA: ABC transporter ATP-binding protein [Candidatus Saccharimonadales bacterium]|jgi:ABC-type polysaccharide/polyol phosphate transport system ATPase subunit|nr:ABC transporter ATP-binding protein [Candidatus Saccharimonadales bacterium]